MKTVMSRKQKSERLRYVHPLEMKAAKHHCRFLTRIYLNSGRYEFCPQTIIVRRLANDGHS